jgi:chorismate--pyruvate lyase
VIKEYACGVSPDEARCLKLPLKSPVWVREVVMSIDGHDCVVARSLAPLMASHGVWQGMRRLSSRPLADILYHQRAIVRSAFEVARLNHTIPLYRTAREIQGDRLKRSGTAALYARRSVFWRHGYPLLVAECFLPAFWLKTVVC